MSDSLPSAEDRAAELLVDATMLLKAGHPEDAVLRMQGAMVFLYKYAPEFKSSGINTLTTNPHHGIPVVDFYDNTTLTTDC